MPRRRVTPAPASASLTGLVLAATLASPRRLPPTRSTSFDRVTSNASTARSVPWVRLRDEATGRRLFVIDVHNSPLNQEADRDSATREEVRLFRRLRDRGVPVLILGDANERREWFCKVARRTGARAANGGTVTDTGCTPPDPSYVDWLMGDGQLGWRDYRAQDVKVSDHRLHSATFRWRKV